jgi:trigger factor
MEITIEHRSHLQKICKIKVPSNQLKTAYQKKLNHFKNNSKIKGFRPGKAPEHFIQKEYGPSLMSDLLNETINASWKDAVEQHNLKLIANPTVDIKEFELDRDLEITYEFEVEPEFNLIDVPGLKVDLIEYTVNDDVVNQSLDDLYVQFGELVSSDKAAKENNVVVADIKTTIDGVITESKNQNILLDKKKSVPGLVDGLIKLKAGAEKSISYSYPEDWADKRYAGKSAEADVNVHEIKEVVKADKAKLKEKLFHQADMTDEDFDKKFHDFVSAQAKDRSFTTNKERVLEAVLGAHEFELPQSHLNQINEQPADKQKDLTDSVRLGYILSKYFVELKTKVQESDIAEYLFKISSNYGISQEEFFPLVAKNKQFMEQMKNELMVNAFVRDALALLTDKVSEKKPFEQF